MNSMMMRMIDSPIEKLGKIIEENGEHCGYIIHFIQIIQKSAYGQSVKANGDGKLFKLFPELK